MWNKVEPLTIKETLFPLRRPETERLTRWPETRLHTEANAALYLQAAQIIQLLIQHADNITAATYSDTVTYSKTATPSCQFMTYI